MKKHITASNLTLDLYLDYVRPAAIAAGILDAAPAYDPNCGEYTAYTADPITADEIAHYMTSACHDAHLDRHDYTTEGEARAMIDAMQTAGEINGFMAPMLTALHDAIIAQHPELAPATEAEQPTETATEREALERINARQNAENLFTNITPADIAREIETMNHEQKEEENTMTTERYDYMEHMTADVIDAIRETYTDDEIRARLDDDRDDFAQTLNDDLWIDDSVTGNASGSYYCNAWRAEEAIAHNWDLIADMIDEFDAADILRKGPEAIDVSIRCYLLCQAIDAALDQLDEEIPEAEETDEDDDADSIPA